MLTIVLAADAEAPNSLPMSPEAIGLITIAVFAALLAVTWAFRSVGRRH